MGPITGLGVLPSAAAAAAAAAGDYDDSSGGGGERASLLPRTNAAAAANSYHGGGGGGGGGGLHATAKDLPSPSKGSSYWGSSSSSSSGAAALLLAQRAWGAVAGVLGALALSSSSSSSSSSSGLLRVLAAAAVSAGWMGVSSLLILVNKHILKDLKFGYPMTVAGMGMATSGALSWAVCRWAKLVDAKTPVSVTYWLHNIAPVGFFMAGTLWAGNLVYLYLSVSFIQMLKAFTPVITMAALFVARMETPTVKMIASVLFIAAGTALAAYGEVHNSVIGLVIMLTSEALEAIRLVMTQLLLTGHRMGPFEGLMWLAPACCGWLLLGAFAIEWPAMAAAGHHTIPAANPGLFALAACLGFAVNVLAYATIKLASSLTLKVLGCVKNAVVIGAAVLLFGEVVTWTQGAGYAISSAAFLVYVQTKMAQIAAGEGAGAPGDKGAAGGGGGRAQGKGGGGGGAAVHGAGGGAAPAGAAAAKQYSPKTGAGGSTIVISKD